LQGWQRKVSPPSPVATPGENLIWSGPRHFVSVLNGTQEPILTAEHAIHILEIILASAESALSGKAIELNTTF
jgi:predicted dehydrogenase